MKLHRSILYDDFMHLSIIYEVLKVRKNVNFQNFKIYVALQNGCYGVLHRFLSSGHIMPNVAKQESYLR